MTNLEIIISEAVANNIYTQEEAMNIVESEGSLPIHTFAMWKKMGYTVKKGEHAKICTKLWKMTNKKTVVENEEGNEDTETYRRMYLVKSFLFTQDQVEKLHSR